MNGFSDLYISGLEFFKERLEPCKYEETDSYKITKMFVNNRNQILEQLFKEN